MIDEQGDERRGPQNEIPAERQARQHPATQDLNKPAPGRDEPPADPGAPRKRGPESPWMGGG